MNSPYTSAAKSSPKIVVLQAPIKRSVLNCACVHHFHFCFLLATYFAIRFLSSVLCSEGASEISQPHCGWTRARKSLRPERTPETPGHFPLCLPAQFLLVVQRDQRPQFFHEFNQCFFVQNSDE